MGKVLMVTCEAEGALYSPRKDMAAPIRIFSDRWVHDDIVVRFGLPAKRERLSKNEYRRARRAARQNPAQGLV